MSISNRIKELVLQLNQWSEEYYINDKPSVSDLVYDAHLNELISLEKENPSFVLENSPTQKVGNKVSDKFSKVNHEFPMLSLSNAFNHEDVFKFDKQIKTILHDQNDIEYACELKIDGLSISIIYENGKLVKGITRGDGSTGEDVTENIKQIKDIPLSIKYNNKIEFRGEIYMSDISFAELNKNNKFANPRNAASGTIRQLDSSVVKKRNLSSFIYSIPNPIEHNLSTHKDVLDFIGDNGLSVNKESQFVTSPESVVRAVDELTSIREKLGYEVDGIVIKVNDNTLHEDIGYTVKSPKYMIAYKFPEEIAETELLAIWPTVGRTGRITYNAKLQAVRLAGTTVVAATLHNSDYVSSKNIQVGDTVKVKKAGEIIPKVIGVSVKNNNAKWKEEQECPSCHNGLKRYSGEVDQYCINEDCPDIKLAKIEHFVSRTAMNIEGVSIEIIRKFIEHGFIKNVASLYELKNHKDEIIALRGFKEKSYTKIINSIDKSKTQDLSKFIFALGIRHIGSKNAKTLAKSFGNLEGFIASKYDNVVKIKDLGKTSAKSLIDYLSSEVNIKVIEKLIELGVKPKPEDMPKSNLFEGKTFVITGTLSQGRKVYAKMIEDHKGSVSSSVSKNTAFLLAGENAGSKKQKADELGVVILKEEELIKMIEGANNG